MKVSRPLAVTVPPAGVLFAESVHEADFRMKERIDPFHKLIYVLKGEVACEHRGLKPLIPAPAGRVLAIPAGVAHRLHDKEPATLLLLCLACGFVDADAGRGELWRTVVAASEDRLWLDRSARQHLESAWRRALLEQAHPRLGGGPLVASLAVQSLVLLARLPVETAEQSSLQRVASVVQEIDETFYEPWNVDRAALRTGLSRRRLTTLFRERTGLSLTDYVIDRRMTHAARLLQSGEHSILGAMFSCGFGDTSHFYRLFKRRFGVAPGQWIHQAERPLGRGKVRPSSV